MTTYEMLDANGYIVFKEGNDTILVDTGSPITIKKASTAGADGGNNLVENLRGMLNNLPTGGMYDMLRNRLGNITDHNLMDLLRSPTGQMLCSQMGIDVDSLDSEQSLDPAKLIGVDFDLIANHVGQDVNMIMGNDRLKDSKVLVDYAARTISFDDEFSCFNNHIMCHLASGYLVVKAEINGMDHKVFFDTGAPISYVSEAWLRGCPKIRATEDFHPLIGAFMSSIYSVPVSFAGHSGNVEIGVLPDKLQKMLEAQGTAVGGSGIDGVIGRSFFPFDKMLIDIACRMISFG